LACLVAQQYGCGSLDRVGYGMLIEGLGWTCYVATVACTLETGLVGKRSSYSALLTDRRSTTRLPAFTGRV